MDEKRGVGYPTKYKPEYCDLIVELAKEGRGIAEFCAHPDVNVARQTPYSWAKQFPEFAEAKELAKTHLQAWWERAGREGMFMQQFNATIWTKNMNNRFRDEWGEKVDVGLSGGLTHEVVTRKIVDPKHG